MTDLQLLELMVEGPDWEGREQAYLQLGKLFRDGKCSPEVALARNELKKNLLTSTVELRRACVLRVFLRGDCSEKLWF